MKFSTEEHTHITPNVDSPLGKSYFPTVQDDSFVFMSVSGYSHNMRSSIEWLDKNSMRRAFYNIVRRRIE